jgi:hypothetical protein
VSDTRSEKAVQQRVRIDAIQCLGEWSVRLWVVTEDEDGGFEEPWAVTLHPRVLDFVGPEWVALSVLDATVTILSLLAKEGYE